MKILAWKLLLATALLLVSVRGLAETPSAAQIAGNYRLMGAMETAAWLELRPDGRFALALSVGSLDAQVEGDWLLNVDSVELRADGADAVLEQVFEIGVASPIEQWADGMPADHPLHAHPREGYFLRLVDMESVEPGALFAIAKLDDGSIVEWMEQWTAPAYSERWFVAEERPGRVIDEVVVFNGQRLNRTMQLRIRPEEVGHVMVNALPEPDTDDGFHFVMNVLDIDQDGRLVPVGMFNAGAAYVRD